MLWAGCLVRGLLGRRTYVPFSLPWATHQRIYDRKRREWLNLTIRDDDDWIQIEHIFFHDEFDLAPTGRKRAIAALYDRILADGSTPLIVDLGANIGLASAYFGREYPKARIVAVEPEPTNIAVAKKNLPASATMIAAAIGSRSGRAGLQDQGRNCAFQVVEGDSIDVVTVPEILPDDATPFLIKIDIEGYEQDLFAENLDWVDRFPILLIELHDWMRPGEQVTRNFVKAIAARDRDLMHFDGYLVSTASLA